MQRRPLHPSPRFPYWEKFIPFALSLALPLPQSHFLFFLNIYLFGYAGSYCSMQDLPYSLQCVGTLGSSLVAQRVKNLPTMLETWVRFLGWEDPLEKGKATHSSILAWRIPWTIIHGVAKSQTRLSGFHFSLSLSSKLLVAKHAGS